MNPILSNGDTRRTALVIGATGGIGGEVAKALIARGWRVRALVRQPADARRRAAWVGPIEWIAGDAMNEADVAAASVGATVIFHGANPPGYKNWRGLAFPMLRNSVAAARQSGARLIFPGNVYNFGPDAGSLVGEAAPQHPLTRKGAIRVEMEQMLAAAAADGVRSLVVRAGDFFGPRQPQGWFRDVMVKPGATLRAVTYPGEPGIGHAWAYLPDLAEAIVRLADIEAALPPFDSVHFGGHWLEPGIAIAEAVRRVSGNPDLPIRRAPWTLYRLAAPFVTVLREVLEMRYLWRVPLRLDNAKLVSLIGPEPHTPLDEALRRTLSALSCLAEMPEARQEAAEAVPR
jgi:nucleoside-diphosphate-sugar epimerase